MVAMGYSAKLTMTRQESKNTGDIGTTCDTTPFAKPIVIIYVSNINLTANTACLAESLDQMATQVREFAERVDDLLDECDKEEPEHLPRDSRLTSVPINESPPSITNDSLALPVMQSLASIRPRPPPCACPSTGALDPNMAHLAITVMYGVELFKNKAGQNMVRITTRIQGTAAQHVEELPLTSDLIERLSLLALAQPADTLQPTND